MVKWRGGVYDQKQQSDMKRGEEGRVGGREGVMQFLLFTPLNYRLQEGEGVSKELLENGFDFHLFLYCINLERKFREAT